MRFPDLYRQWAGPDLGVSSCGFADNRPEFYKGLREEDEPVVWRFIEENYLSKYGGFVHVAFDWMEDGLWKAPYPGSAGLGVSLSPEYFGIAGPLAARIQAWQAALDRLDVHETNPDHEASQIEGLEIAKPVKMFLGEDHYVEFRPFREISVRDGEAVEFEVPEFTTNLTR
jgi:hypothetical protein